MHPRAERLPSGKVLRGNSALGTGGKDAGVFDNAFGGFVEPIAVAVRARGHAGFDDGIATFADFVFLRRGDDFFGAGGALGEVVLFSGHASVAIRARSGGR